MGPQGLICGNGRTLTVLYRSGLEHNLRAALQAYWTAPGIGPGICIHLFDCQSVRATPVNPGAPHRSSHDVRPLGDAVGPTKGTDTVERVNLSWAKVDEEDLIRVVIDALA